MRRILLAALVTALAAASLAQEGLPDHAPGTICLTEQFWCWAQPPGTPGYPCVCQTPTGPIQGILG